MTDIVKFSLYLETPDGDYSEFESKREVKQSDSVRSHAISVIQEAIDSGAKSRVTHIDNTYPLQIYLAEDGLQSPTEGFSKYGFGIKYIINKDQSIRVLNGYEPLYIDVTFSEINEVVRAGYISGSSKHLIVGVPSGLGATGGLTSVEWIGFLMALSAPAKLGWKHALHILNFPRRLQLQKIANNWRSNGVLYPYTLREFIDTKAEWRLSEVKKRLKLTDEYAIKLLTALGYEPLGDKWRITHSESSINNRDRWLSLEEKYIEPYQHSDIEYTEMSENTRLAVVVALLATVVTFITLADNSVFEPVKIILAISGLFQFLFLLFSAELLRFNYKRSVVRFFDSYTTVDAWRKRFYDWSVQVYLLAFVGLGALIFIEYIAPEATGATDYIRDLARAVFDIDQTNLGLASLVGALLVLAGAYILALLVRLVLLAWMRLRGTSQ